MRRAGKTRMWCGIGVVALGLSIFVATNVADESAPKTQEVRAVSKEALMPLQDLVGGWIGTGQPKRGSSAGAWREKAEWRWKFEGSQAGLSCSVEEGKLLQSALVTFDAKTKEFQLKTTEPGPAKAQERRYAGSFDGKKLVFDEVADEKSDAHRITITRLNDKRTLVLFEKKGASQNFYARVAEVGYTREGTRLAESDQTGPECVVTGGLGTIKVTHKGETYWVCCTGCRDAFNDDPEGILAEYQKKVAERKAKKSS